MLPAFKFNVDPAQIGPFEDAVGAAGIVFTTTAVVPAGPVQPVTVAVTEYVPAPAVVILLIEGF